MKSIFRSFWSGVLGITLLLPATWFILSLLLRVCFGATGWYYSMAPSFLQTPFNLFAWHKAQFILGSLILATVLNGLAILRFRFQRRDSGVRIGIGYNRYWLNTAIALQSALLLLGLVIYTLIQHVRY
jgi:hypothetical protein